MKKRAADPGGALCDQSGQMAQRRLTDVAPDSPSPSMHAFVFRLRLSRVRLHGNDTQVLEIA